MSLGRVGDIADGSSSGRTKYVAYKYLGASMVVDANHPAVPTGLRLTYAGAGGYGGLDRFGRVAWQRWLRSSGSVAADRYFYGYDRAGNRTWRAERSNASSAAGQRDEAYVYDKLDRLIGAKRGILPDKPYQAPYPGDATLDGVVDGFDYTVLLLNWLGSGKTWTQADFNGDSKVDFDDNTILSLNWLADPNETVARSWSWSLSPTGNWSSSMINDANQTRTHDNANQITSISGVALAPLYDQAGNNVRGPRPADPNANNAAHFRYDAWNRLSTIHLDDGVTSGTLDANDTLLATYRYDGLNRRVMKVTHDDPNTTTQYMYFNENWQIVEIRRGVNQTPTAAAYKQFVWDIRYIDSPVCRWWDKDSDGTMESTAGEMQYFTNDGNFNTTALIDANSGGVVERYLYDPYGKPTFLDANWAPRSSSSYDNEILYCGYRYDIETGLFEVKNRYYNWLTGTWGSRDRNGSGDGVNLNQYVKSSPLAHVDPRGTEGEDTIDPEFRIGTTTPADDAPFSGGYDMYRTRTESGEAAIVAVSDAGETKTFTETGDAEAFQKYNGKLEQKGHEPLSQWKKKLTPKQWKAKYYPETLADVAVDPDTYFRDTAAYETIDEWVYPEFLREGTLRKGGPQSFETASNKYLRYNANSLNPYSKASP